MTEERLIEFEKRAQAQAAFYEEFMYDYSDKAIHYNFDAMLLSAEDVADLVKEVRRLQKEVKQYQIAEEEGRLVVLPTQEEMEELLCDFCGCPDELKGSHLGPNGPYGCGGSWCGNAYDKFLDEVEDLTGVQVGKENENDT